jgi:hypothetical protein
VERGPFQLNVWVDFFYPQKEGEIVDIKESVRGKRKVLFE